MKKTQKKAEVFFIATKYKNKPIRIDFYTKKWKHVPAKEVKKEETREGVRYFAFM